MTPELKVLALALLLQGVQYALLSISANRELGIAKTLSPRDPQRLGKPLHELLGVKSGRLHRALNNHFEALIMFSIAVAIISLADRNSGFSANCAWVYLFARILYVPAYYFGLSPWRTLIWLTGFLATFAMLLSVVI